MLAQPKFSENHLHNLMNLTLHANAICGRTAVVRPAEWIQRNTSKSVHAVMEQHCLQKQRKDTTQEPYSQRSLRCTGFLHRICLTEWEKTPNKPKAKHS